MPVEWRAVKQQVRGALRDEVRRLAGVGQEPHFQS